MKKAIVCSDLPVLREVLNESNSILVDCDNIEEWKAAINILEDSTVRNKLSLNAYDDFIKYYTWNNRADFVILGCKQ